MGFISLIRASEVYREPRRFTRSLGGGVALKNTAAEKLFLHVAHTGSGCMCMIIALIYLEYISVKGKSSCRFDSRLKFRGLKEMKHKNWVTKDENIWKPQIR